MASAYVAPITLGFTPAGGDLIGGTVNGVEVNGKWDSSIGGVKLYEGALDVSTYGDDDGQHVCSVGIIDGQALIVMESESAPTTDYELHLYRYAPADIVQIPQEYVEGLEDVAADATAAKTAAETAQSTANAAKTTAETAFRIIQNSEESTVSISALGAYGGNMANYADLGALNIPIGSKITLTKKDSTESHSVIWDGSSANFYIGTPTRYTLQLAVKPNGKYRISNTGTFTSEESTLAYQKVVVPSVAYNVHTGAWLPPYLCCSAIHLVGSRESNGVYRIFKITVDDTGTLSVTKVTT